MKFLYKIINGAVISCIRIYQNTVSLLFPSACRYEPSCSEYTIQALKKYGLISGGVMGLKRLVRCHPFHSGGYDPVP